MKLLQWMPSYLEKPFSEALINKMLRKRLHWLMMMISVSSRFVEDFDAHIWHNFTFLNERKSNSSSVWTVRLTVSAQKKTRVHSRQKHRKSLKTKLAKEVHWGPLRTQALRRSFPTRPGHDVRTDSVQSRSQCWSVSWVIVHANVSCSRTEPGLLVWEQNTLTWCQLCFL